MTHSHLPVYVGPDALPELVRFCRERQLQHFALIADDNTYAALGARAESELRAQGWDVLTVVLTGEEIGADARSIFQVLLALDRVPRTFIGVGSGTITDVSRVISHRTGAEFISLPTAASVDGFTSIGAPMVIDGAKITVNAHGPLAVFGRPADPVRRAAAADRGRLRRPARQAHLDRRLGAGRAVVGRAV